MPCSVKGSAANAPCWWQPMAPSTRAQLKRAREEEEERRCRLFLEGEGDGPLLQLCACHGSAKLVHRHCLEKWRRTSLKEDAAYRCGECKDEYRDALSLELLRARLQAERADGEVTVFTLDTLGTELQVQGKYDEAEPLYREAVKVSRETVGDRHPDTLGSINNLGTLLWDKGDLAAAELLCREALEGLRETLGDQHPNTIACSDNLGKLLLARAERKRRPRRRGATAARDGL